VAQLQVFALICKPPCKLLHTRHLESVRRAKQSQSSDHVRILWPADEQYGSTSKLVLQWANLLRMLRYKSHGM